MALSLASSFSDHIEKPDEDKESVLPIHPGAAAYFASNDKTFFDRYDDWFYLGAMALSGLISGLAAIVASARAWIRRSTLRTVDQLIQLQLAAREAADEGALDAAELAVSRLSIQALRHARDGKFDEPGLAALSLAMEECRQAIADRRAKLMQAPASWVPLAGRIRHTGRELAFQPKRA
jgi:hypothetical protein